MVNARLLDEDARALSRFSDGLNKRISRNDAGVKEGALRLVSPWPGRERFACKVDYRVHFVDATTPAIRRLPIPLNGFSACGDFWAGMAVQQIDLMFINQQRSGECTPEKTRATRD
jgi:hypothetical protein